jgi:sensor c-di-GMP phosphodiesterase-like protein
VEILYVLGAIGALAAVVGYTIISRLPSGSTNDDDRILDQQRKVDAEDSPPKPAGSILATTAKALIATVVFAGLLVVGPLGWVIGIILFVAYVYSQKRKEKQEQEVKRQEDYRRDVQRGLR